MLSAWRARTDEQGRPCAASYYFDTLTEEVGEAPSPSSVDTAASEREHAIATVIGWSDGERRRPEVPWWPVLRAAVVVEQDRRSFRSAQSYEGVLPSGRVPWLVAPETVWSASRLETYQTCPFQFFGQYALGLYELDSEMESADAAARGTAIHDILKQTLAHLAESRAPLTTANIDETIQRVRELGPRLWDEAPRRFGFGRAAIWRLTGPETLEAIEALLRREAERNELAGIDRTVGPEVEFREELPTSDGPMQFFAKIDRLDAGPGFVQVVDYKTGREIVARDLKRGRRLQLQLYSELARRGFGVERVLARYAYRDPNSESWDLDTAREDNARLLDDALAVAGDTRQRVREGEFQVAPQDPGCPSYCSFRSACRVNQFSRWKQWS